MKKIVLLVLLALFIATFAICDEESLTAEQDVLPLAEVEELGAVETLAVKKAKKHIHGKKIHKRHHHAGKKGHKRSHKKHLPKKAATKKPANKIAKKANRKARRQQKKAARKAKKQQTKTRLQVLEMKVNALMAAEKSLEKAEADLSKLAGQTGAQPTGNKVSISQAVINTLNTKVAALENNFNAQMKAANDKIAALTNQVNYANGKITSLEASLNQLRTQVNVAPIQADLNNVKNSVASINNNLNARVANLENINNQKNVGPVSFPRGILVGNRWIINEEGTGTYEALVFRDRIRSQTRDSRYAFFKERYVDL